MKMPPHDDRPGHQGARTADSAPGTEPPGIRLTRVRIQNFRCIRDLTLDLDETTVLIGENNSGKTAVLKAIEHCLDRLRRPNTRVFDEYDYYLKDENASPEDAEPIRIELTLAEPAPRAMPLELREDLAEVLVGAEADQRKLTLRVTSGYDAGQSDFVTESEFLDAASEPMKRASAALLGAVRRAMPVRFLSALRDAGKHFGTRGPYWRDFLSSRDLSDADREGFESELAELNRRLIDAHPPLREVRNKLGRAREVIAFGRDDPVTVDALPAQASALLSQARVNMTSRQGAKIPLDRQGEGAQSLAVLFLFDASLRRRLDDEGEGGQPLTILEEPEAHLHPAAVRALMDAVQSFPGQKILSTHSGDLVGAVDPKSVRRLVYRDGAVRAYRADVGPMSRKDRRTFQRKIRRGRGDLLFARCWLLYEGETEAVLFPRAAEALGVNLDREGVACLQCSEITPAALFRTANQFGIPWYLVYDGDRGRKKYENAALENLDGVDAADRCICPYPNVEDFLWNSGFGDLYSKDVNKVDAATRAADRMMDGSTPVPEGLKRIIHKAVTLARE